MPLMPDRNPDIAAQIRASLRHLAIATAVLYVVVIGLLVVSIVLALRTNSALCSLRGDLQDRVTQSETFLAKHPNGFAGISAATIRSSLDGQRRTIRALHILYCTNTP
jgi:hypothetical protein